MRHRTPPLFLLAAAALLTVSCGQRESPVRNVLLISIDTLRADHLDSYSHDRPTSPHLEALEYL